jgi:hypothetical protein
VGPNDHSAFGIRHSAFGIRHSAFGYLQRSHILKRCLPISVGGDSRVAPVHVDALAEGICLAAEHAQAGDDYVFSGESERFSELFREFAPQPGGMKVRVFMPRWFMRPQMVLFEALLRRAGLSAFLSRDLVDQSRGDYDYSSSKAQEELGWSCPQPQKCGTRSSPMNSSSSPSKTACATSCAQSLSFLRSDYARAEAHFARQHQYIMISLYVWNLMNRRVSAIS